MREVDFVVVGQGIGGTMLAHHIEKYGGSVLIIDDGHQSSSSMIAAGLINPITGRKYVKSWRIEDFLPYAKSIYTEISAKLDAKTYSNKTIFRALYGAKEENQFYARALDPIAEQYMNTKADSSQYHGKIKNTLSYGGVIGGQVHLQTLLTSYRQYWQDREQLKEEVFDYDLLDYRDGHFQYRDIKSKYIIFSEGHRSSENPYFSNIDHEGAKGEVLLVRIAGSPFEDILRHKLFVIPVENDIYWIGANYIWDYQDQHPTEKEKNRLITMLDDILNIPYEVVDHKAAIRPTVKQRRPRIGASDLYKDMYLFAGLGTKGSSLAPYWANHLIQHILEHEKIDDEVKI